MSGLNRRALRNQYCYLTALTVVLLDQATKYLVITHLELGASVPILGGLLCLTLTRNPGGAFGLFQAWTQLLVIVAIIVVVCILLLVRRKADMSPILIVSVGLELGGAVGNLIDRIRFHYVVDFVDLRVWPVFNIADVAITIGLFLLAYYVFVNEPHCRPVDNSIREGPESSA